MLKKFNLCYQVVFFFKKKKVYTFMLDCFGLFRDHVADELFVGICVLLSIRVTAIPVFVNSSKGRNAMG